VAAALAKHYRVFAPDLVSGDAAEDGQRVLALVDAQAGPDARFHLVGHGYGGIVALEIARRQPARVIDATLYEPTCFDLLADRADREFIARVTRAVELLAARGLDAGAARMFHDFWHGPGAFDAKEQSAQFALAAQVQRLLPELRVAREKTRDYAGVTVPVKLLGGSRSFGLTRRVLEALAAVLPVATLGWIDGDHMAPVEAPARFLEALLPGAPELTARP